MNSNESAPADVEYLRRCEVCAETFIADRRSAPICSKKACHAMIAEFEDFQTLQFMLNLSRWTGGKSQKQLRKEYYEWQLRDAMKELWRSAEPLALVVLRCSKISRSFGRRLLLSAPGCVRNRPKRRAG
jgi:hypothetical protein